LDNWQRGVCATFCPGNENILRDLREQLYLNNISYYIFWKYQVNPLSSSPYTSIWPLSSLKTTRESRAEQTAEMWCVRFWSTLFRIIIALTFYRPQAISGLIALTID